MKRFIALILALCCTLSLAACGGGGSSTGGGGDDIKYNVRGDNKTTINFTSYAGGIGGDWVDIVCEEFAKKHAKTHFGNGSKEGVFINLTKTMNISLSGLSTSGQHIITSCNNGTPNNIANSGELYDLTSIITDTTREGGSLESIIFDHTLSNLKANDGNYYGLPHFEYYEGLQYNRKVFSNEKALFADASDTTAISYKSKFSNVTFKFTNDDGVLSKGPDGIPGNEDDGLPASLEEMLVLFDYFKQRTNYSPVVVSGACINYTDTIVAGLQAALAGQEQMQNYYNSKGDVEVVCRDAEGNIEFTSEDLFKGVNYIKKPRTKVVTLNDENGYLGTDMVARFYALSFMEIMQKEGWFSEEINNPNISHYNAQLALLVGSAMPGYTNSAMLSDYSYWYNETVFGGNFNQTKYVGKTEKDFDVRFMCQPTSFYYNANQPQKPASIALANDAYFFVNNTVKKNADVEEAVVEFVKFLYSDEMIRKVTVLSGFARSMEYELEDSDLAAMSNYTRRLWQLRKTDGSNVIYNAGTTNGHKLNRGSLYIRGSRVKCDNASFAYEGIQKNKTELFFNKTVIKPADWKTA